MRLPHGTRRAVAHGRPRAAAEAGKPPAPTSARSTAGARAPGPRSSPTGQAPAAHRLRSACGEGRRPRARYGRTDAHWGLHVISTCYAVSWGAQGKSAQGQGFLETALTFHLRRNSKTLVTRANPNVDPDIEEIRLQNCGNPRRSQSRKNNCSVAQSCPTPCDPWTTARQASLSFNNR